MQFCVDHIYSELAYHINFALINKDAIRVELEKVFGGTTFAEIKAKHPALISETDEEIEFDHLAFFRLIWEALSGECERRNSMFDDISTRKMFKAILQKDGINKLITYRGHAF